MKKIFTNKEISWLSFNARVLQEAANPDVPLIQRLRFLGIFSSNLDEFFRVRIATLKRISTLSAKARTLIGHNPNEVLSVIEHIVVEQHREFDRLYRGIIDELAQNGIHIIDENQLTEEQGIFVKAFFHHHVRHMIVPIMIDQVKKLPALRDQFIYLAVRLRHGKKPEKIKDSLIELPTDMISRFLILPEIENKKHIILLDDVIRYSLKDIFSIFPIDHYEAYTIKLTRDAELDIDDDVSQSYIKKISRSLKKRKEGRPVRFIYDDKIPAELLAVIIRKLGIKPRDTLASSARYHNFRDFIAFPDFGMKNLVYEPTRRLPHRVIKPSASLIKQIYKKDVLLHSTYQKFEYVIDLLREAAIDPKVTSIKLTIYRTAKRSALLNTLINASRNGKYVVAILELQARFDEEANIYWANRLQEEGVRVIYGVPGLKVHSKLCLISRKTGKGQKNYAIFGTGNFNEDTIHVYSDMFLLTSHHGLTSEVAKAFEFFEHNYKVIDFKHLMVAPFNLRENVSALITTEIENAKAGKPAEIFIKVNNLVDPKIIELLYDASQNGVAVKLIVRTMFSLVPGIKGMSANIEAISIVDKFLEHARVFVFHNNGDPLVYISSADLMPRNLDHRVEVAAPIYDKAIKREIIDFLELQWKDNTKARILNKELDNSYRKTSDDTAIRSQFDFYDYLKRKLEKTSSRAGQPMKKT